jgi:ADP-heptose:LPS heptosyltransferase
MMRILALVPGGISEQILFFPTLATLKTQYPQAVIDVIVEPRAKSAYRVCPHVNEVLAFDYRDRNGLADYLNLLGIIRDREYEAAITSARQWAIEVLLWLNGIPQRVGYQNSGSVFLSAAVPFKPDQYVPFLYHDLTQGFGIHTPCPPVAVTLPKADIEWMESTQKRLDLGGSGYVVLNGGAIRQADTGDFPYPIAQWHAIMDDIRDKQPDLKIVLIPPAEDTGWVQAMQDRHPGLTVVRPDDVGKMAALLAGANLVICTEGIPMHLAIAVGTYTIAILGKTPAAQIIPPDQEKFIGLQVPSGKEADVKPAMVLKRVWR